jgi:hypothetical protein
MENKPLMPLATAVWLVDNTSLSFAQISQFCQLHELEIQSIADGEEAYNMKGLNPIASGQLTKDEIKRCEDDGNAELAISIPILAIEFSTSSEDPRSVSSF